MHNLDTFLFTVVHQGVGAYPLLDHFFIILTSYIVYAVIVLVLIHVALVHVFFARDGALRRVRIRRGAEIALSIGVTATLVWLLKIFVAHPRPFVTLAEKVTPLVSAAPYQSFPSAHAALTMACAIAVLPYHKHLGHLLIAFSFVVALSRLYTGVHYPFDVGAGLLIGYIIPKLIHRSFQTAPSVSK